MGAHWKSVAREAGYDPAKVVDAPRAGGKIKAVIAVSDMKNAVIGDGTACSGARCLKRVLDADWAYVGASSAFVVLKGSKRILRYLVNGIARRQDRTMSVVGEQIILRPPTPTATLQGKAKQAKVRATRAIATSAKKKPMRRSLAAQLRATA
jgi:hypothetical protein